MNDSPPYLKRLSKVLFLPDEFASAVSGALRDLANTARGPRLKTALGEDRLERLRDSSTISDPDIQDRLNVALGGVPGGNPDIEEPPITVDPVDPDEGENPPPSWRRERRTR